MVPYRPVHLHSILLEGLQDPLDNIFAISTQRDVAPLLPLLLPACSYILLLFPAWDGTFALSPPTRKSSDGFMTPALSGQQSLR